MKTLRWYALPSFLTVTWVLLAAGTLIQLAGLGGALAQLDGSTHVAPQDDATEWVVKVQ